MATWLRLRLRRLFLGVMLLLVGTLGWLAWRLLLQDQQLVAQRLMERRDTAADVAVAVLERRLAEIRQDLDLIANGGGPAKPPNPSDGTVFVRFSSGTFRTWPEHSLAYFPEVREEPEAPASVFAAADKLEFEMHDYPGAVAALRNLLNSADVKIRAAALARVARNYANAGKPPEALDAYEALAQLGAVRVAGMPATLAADEGELWVFDRQGDVDDARNAAEKLSHDLNSGQWPITAAAYQVLTEEVSHRLPGDASHNDLRVSAAEGAQRLWEQWSPGISGAGMSADSSLLLWKTVGGNFAGFEGNARFLEGVAAELKPLFDARKAQLVLSDADGRQVFGAAPAGDYRPAVRLASATQLPWTVQVFNSADSAAELRSHRDLVLAALSVLLALLLAGTWLIGHAVARELAVARLQSDFVSAVSHEFRTPLTTLCQLSELLVRGRVSGEEDRQQYYQLLQNESNRLRRLVETLLNFGRLEAGKMQLRFEPLDAAALLRQSASEFEQGQQARGRHFEVATCAPSTVRGDRETLRCVFWNLFENAVKYSPGTDTVWVEMARRSGQVEISVRDRGVGIPPSEQKRIFDKFVRGSAARDVEIRGTGIGLALARQIVREHGGDITVDSKPGRGSTFRVRLPEVDA